jgi:Spy/CpxP family protein refolding chaperone
MKRQLVKLAAAGSLAAGMIFAQAQTVQPPAGQANQPQNKQAQSGKAHRNWNGARNVRMAGHQRMMAALNLTETQKAQAKTIFSSARGQSKPVRAELRQNREAVAAAVKADNRAQIEKLSSERGKLMAKLSATRGEAMASFYKTLTPEQRAKADQIQARFQARARQFREHRGTRTNG